MNANFKKIIDKQDKDNYSLLVISDDEGKTSRAVQYCKTKDLNKVKNLRMHYPAGNDEKIVIENCHKIKMEIVRDTKCKTSKSIPYLNNELLDIQFTGYQNICNERAECYDITFRNIVYQFAITPTDRINNELTSYANPMILIGDAAELHWIIVSALLDFFYPLREKQRGGSTVINTVYKYNF